MGWNDDGYGIVVKATEVKLYTTDHSWGMKLSQLGRQTGQVRILTYSLPDLAYVTKQLGRRPKDVAMICHARFRDRAIAVKARFPGIEISLSIRLHAKLLLIAPDTVYVTSANFGESDWDELGVGVRSKAGHDWYAGMFDRLWRESEVVTVP